MDVGALKDNMVKMLELLEIMKSKVDFIEAETKGLRIRVEKLETEKIKA